MTEQEPGIEAAMNQITQQSRETHPSWMVRDLEQDNFQYLFLDPQENTCIPFHNNLNTRLIERDNFKTVVPSLINNDNANYMSIIHISEPTIRTHS